VRQQTDKVDERLRSIGTNNNNNSSKDDSVQLKSLHSKVNHLKTMMTTDRQNYKRTNADHAGKLELILRFLNWNDMAEGNLLEATESNKEGENNQEMPIGDTAVARRPTTTGGNSGGFKFPLGAAPGDNAVVRRSTTTTGGTASGDMATANSGGFKFPGASRFSYV
jgi:hypothetical protein